jgi:hypothetical protein
MLSTMVRNRQGGKCVIACSAWKWAMTNKGLKDHPNRCLQSLGWQEPYFFDYGGWNLKKNFKNIKCAHEKDKLGNFTFEYS